MLASQKQRKLREATALGCEVEMGGRGEVFNPDGEPEITIRRVPTKMRQLTDDRPWMRST